MLFFRSEEFIDDGAGQRSYPTACRTMDQLHLAVTWYSAGLEEVSRRPAGAGGCEAFSRALGLPEISGTRTPIHLSRHIHTTLTSDL